MDPTHRNADSVCVAFPGFEARQRIFELGIDAKTPYALKPEDYNALAEKTEGYPGADISMRARRVRQRKCVCDPFQEGLHRGRRQVRSLLARYSWCRDDDVVQYRACSVPRASNSEGVPFSKAIEAI